MKATTALIGMRSGRLTIVSEGSRRAGKRTVDCKCDCGNQLNIFATHFTSGKTKSCGCLRGSHRMSNSNTYHTWEAMKQRCTNENHIEYKNYGGRGIEISKEWMSFENFYRDMGDRPDGMTIERIDNSLGYFNGNCKWASHTTQGYNKRKKEGTTSKYVGVSFSKEKNKWKAQIKFKGKNSHIGYFSSESEAKSAYDKALKLNRERDAIAAGKIPGVKLDD